MSSLFAKPENALAKAKDLVRVDKKDQAIRTLHSILVSRRYRTWQETHENIMFLYIKLAVDLRKSTKEAFVQYRLICQQAKQDSLERVLIKYRELSEAKAAEAVEEADAHSLSAVEDLEEIEQTPESIMLLCISGEDAKARSDRMIVTPWLKYLWETYRAILEVLRNNGTLQQLYQQTARQAFQFCLQHKRSTEFRRLCEILRTHILVINKHHAQPNSVNLNSPETAKMYLNTRFEQLRVAAELELWQEAYRTIEDIHENTRLSKVPPRAEMLNTYYRRLSEIFWASGNHLFHAYSLAKYYTLVQGDESMSAEAKKSLASAVVLATLVIPLGVDDQAENMFSEENEGNMRLANLLGFKKETPTRSRLQNGLSILGLLDPNVITDQVRELYALLESQSAYAPLRLSRSLKDLVDVIVKDESLAKYVEQLNHIAVLRLTQQLSCVYRNMSLTRFKTLVPDLPWLVVESELVEAIRKGQLHLRIDHQADVVVFQQGAIESKRIKSQLVTLARKLDVCVHQIKALTPPDVKQQQRQRQQIFDTIKVGAEEENRRVFERQEVIEKRKIAHEENLKQKNIDDSREKASAQKARMDEERTRLDDEKKRREEERVQREADAVKFREKAALAKQLAEKVVELEEKGITSKAMKKLQQMTGGDLADIDKDALIQADRDVQLQRKRDLEQRLKESYRKVNYLAKALRIEEKPKILAQQEKRRELERDQNEETFLKQKASHKQRHELGVAEKYRLLRMVEQKKAYHAVLLAKRQAECEQAKAAQFQRILDRRVERQREADMRRAHEEAAAREAERQSLRRAAQEEEKAKLAAEKERLEAEARQRAIEEDERERARDERERDRGRGGYGRGERDRGGYGRDDRDRGGYGRDRGGFGRRDERDRDEGRSESVDKWRRSGGDDRDTGGDGGGGRKRLNLAKRSVPMPEQERSDTGRSGDWGSRDGERGRDAGPRSGAPTGERKRLNLQKRSIPIADGGAPASSSSAGDGFEMAKGKRNAKR